jgi:acyl-coenzyme A synthetase/AMP-(fatty) acid ligase
MTAETVETWPGYRVIPDRINLCAEAIDRQITAGLADKAAFIFDQGEITYATLSRQVNALASGLREHGIDRGTPVLIRLTNSLEYVVAFLALTRLGALPVLMNSLLGPEEVDYVLEHSDAEAAITFDDIAEHLRGLRDRLPKGLIVARGAEAGDVAFEALLVAGQGQTVTPADTGANDRAFSVYTSGTTGRPKGIVHAHRWIVAQGDMNRLRIAPQPGDVVMATGEWSFISALGHNVLFALRNGITGTILEGPAHPDAVLEAVGKFGVTLIYSVATVYRRILAIDGVENRYDLSTLRGCNATGEALEAATYTEWVSRMGCPIWEHYGVSELQLVFGQSPHWPIKPGSVGKALPGTRVDVLDDDYNNLPAGEIGNLLIASDNPGFFLGYHKDPDKTAEIVHDGWYHTGDLAYADEDGYIWIAGRSDDCFKSRGIFISPIEIENAIRQQDGVVEACVVPLADKEIGNRIRAVIVLRDGMTGTIERAKEMRAALRTRIAPYKVPQVIEFAGDLPKSSVGKVLRRALINQTAEKA